MVNRMDISEDRLLLTPSIHNSTLQAEWLSLINKTNYENILKKFLRPRGKDVEGLQCMYITMFKRLACREKALMQTTVNAIILGYA